MTTKSFLKKTFTLTPIIYTISTFIIIIISVFNGPDQMGIYQGVDVKTHLFFFAFSLFSAIGITASKIDKIPSYARYFVEGGSMTLGFLLFVVLPRDGMNFTKACGWTFGFAAMYALVRVVIAIIKYDEKSGKKNVKASTKTNRKVTKKTREDALYGKTKKSEPEYTNLFTTDKK